MKNHTKLCKKYNSYVYDEKNCTICDQVFDTKDEVYVHIDNDHNMTSVQDPEMSIVANQSYITNIKTENVEKPKKKFTKSGFRFEWFEVQWLENSFRRSQYPNAYEVEELEMRTGLTKTQIKVDKIKPERCICICLRSFTTM